MNELPPEQARRVAETIISVLSIVLGAYVLCRWWLD